MDLAAEMTEHDVVRPDGYRLGICSPESAEPEQAYPGRRADPNPSPGLANQIRKQSSGICYMPYRVWASTKCAAQPLAESGIPV